MRKTKIVATLGPSTDSVLSQVLAAGVDVVRLNFSHGNPEDHFRRSRSVREYAKTNARDIGILCDLQGPKIRIESFAQGPVDLVAGDAFTLDTALAPDQGNAREVGCAYKELPTDLSVGDILLLNDGAIVLRVQSVGGTRIRTQVVTGGPLSDRKGINRQGGGLSAAALTEKDKADVIHAAELGADFIAVSFPRTADDMQQARALVKAAGGHALLVAKIERADCLEHLNELVDASDVIMVARGDLGVEIGDAELPGWQKRIISAAREKNRMIITATQMMESMINNPIPTRAEVLDVANAVLDGTDAVMLSGETAAGKYPVRVVQKMAHVCLGAEGHVDLRRKRISADQRVHFERTDEAIAMASAWTATHMNAKSIVSLTDSGWTAQLMSRTETDIPIFAMTQHEATRRRMSLCRGVFPIAFTPTRLDKQTPIREAVEALVERGDLVHGDRAVITKGDFTGPGGTNAMKIVTVGELKREEEWE